MKKLFTICLSIFSFSVLLAQPLGWSHIEHIQIQENSGTTVPAYQLKITFDTQAPISLGEMNADGSDIRFGSECNVADLDYWIESGINTTSTVIWIKTDTLFANEINYIHMFYGNPAATAISNLTTVFYGPHSSTDSLAYTNAGGVTDSQRGFRFYPNEDILVTAFGKFEPTGSTRYITLFDVTTTGILRQEQVSGPAAQYTYMNISSPIWLIQGTQYLLEMYQGSSDGYYFGAGPQVGQHLTYLDMRYCNGCTQNTYPNNYLNGIQYGYPDMWYFTKTNLNPAPTITITDVLTGSLGPDVSSCVEYTLDADYNGATYLWNDGTTTQTLYVNTSGPYHVQGTTAGNCPYADTISVIINPLPNVNLGADTILCNTSIVLDAQNPGATYLWNDATTLDTLITSLTADYHVEVTDTNGCVNSDTIHITNASLPVIDGSITPGIACYADSVLFDATGGVSYTWTDVITNGLHPVFDDMSYIVTGIDSNGCINTDTAVVAVNHLPIVDFICNENVVCLTSAPVVISGGTPAGGIYSGTGISGGNFLPSIGIGTYVINYTYTDANNCTVTANDDITVLACAGVEETVFGTVSIFPNPTSGIVNVHVENLFENTSINLYDMLGKNVFNSILVNNQSVLNLQVHPGMYVLEVRTGSQVMKQQLIIQ